MDTLGDMLSQIKNAGMANKSSVVTPASKFKSAVLDVLVREGYVQSVTKKARKGKPVLDISIAYAENGKPKMQQIERVSKLSRRMYSSAQALKPIRQGYGNVILSTPKGIMTGGQAKKENVGGEVLFTLY